MIKINGASPTSIYAGEASVSKICLGYNDVWPVEAVRASEFQVRSGPTSDTVVKTIEFTQSSVEHPLLVDWGDGTCESETSTLTAELSHRYPEYSTYYTIRAVCPDGESWILSRHPGGKVLRLARITELGYRALASNTAEEITLPNTLTTIREWAFATCLYLQKVVIPASVTTVEGRPFLGCDEEKLTIYCEASEKPSGWSNSWAECGNGVTFNVVWGYNGS